MSRVKAITEALVPVFERYQDTVIFAYLFGSAVKDKGYPRGDIDIAVFLSHGARESYSDIKLSLYADFCRTLKGNDIDIMVLNDATNIIILDEIVRYGIVLYDMNPELREEFEIKVLHRAIDFKVQRLAVMGV